MPHFDLPGGSIGLTMWLHFATACLAGGLTPKSPLPWGQVPHLTQCVIVPAKWHLNPSNGLSSVHKCD